MSSHDELKPFLAKLKTVFDRSPEGMVITDMTKDKQPVIYCNNAFIEITGFSREETIGYNCRFLQGVEKDQAGLQLVRSAIKTDQSCRVVLRNYRKDGELFYNRLSLFPIQDSTGTTIYYMGVQDDITSLILKKEEIQRLRSNQEVLETEVHHRVKNNLAVISSLLDLDVDSSSETKTLQKTRMRIQSMKMIHENLYQKEGFSRVEFGSVLFELTDAFRNYRKPSQANLNFIIDSEPVPLNVNQAIPLSIILSELVHNIYNHAYPESESGEVQIKFYKISDQKVALRVTDHGEGLKDEDQPRDTNNMGYLIIDTLVQQLEAELSVETEQGLSAEIIFKKSDSSGSGQSQAI
ncbi:histidine kinase dimerization/phosphoacceptor domain -containing protein [Fodinibius halophilus]|uniref:histidine kinase n=1 Tax=Fodinibius halophilus TaxID=1736908 RepID=A0A6M1SYL5_9BACT|nr:histidine kinase dimerization/phosphoacceptor domain -containing protein [Fodinibius halophilus]NGP88968.1 PAS domain-containing protein [Fodinibius halophilus]